MTIDVETYLQQLAKGKNKLDTWEKAIFQLFHANTSYQNIVDYLRQNDVHASKAEVHRFIHRKKRRHLLATNPAGGIRSDHPATGGQPGKTAKNDAERTEAEKPQQEGSRPKFSWRQCREQDKPEW